MSVAFSQLPKLPLSPALTAVVLLSQLHPPNVPYMLDSSSFLAKKLEKLFSHCGKSILEVEVHMAAEGAVARRKITNYNT